MYHKARSSRSIFPKTLAHHNHVRIPLSTRPTHHSLLGFILTILNRVYVFVWSCYQCGDYETSIGSMNTYYSSGNDLQGRGRGLTEVASRKLHIATAGKY
jgi:hypothetical protein